MAASLTRVPNAFNICCFDFFPIFFFPQFVILFWGGVGDGDADEEIFRKTRLSVSAIVAKVHTIDWTVELLKNGIMRTGMRANWYGIIGECFG